MKSSLAETHFAGYENGGKQYKLWHLAPGGRIGMVLANGSLSFRSGGEGEICKNIINADLVDCIIAMPAQLFYTRQIPVSLWSIAKNKKQKGKTLFIDARKMGTLEDAKGFCAFFTTQEITKQDYIMTPGRYVGIEEQEEDGEPLEEKMGQLTAELPELFVKSHGLEDDIRKRLGAIGNEL